MARTEVHKAEFDIEYMDRRTYVPLQPSATDVATGTIEGVPFSVSLGGKDRNDPAIYVIVRDHIAKLPITELVEGVLAAQYEPEPDSVAPRILAD